MEVADQWRREWAGTAEYGRVVEGGVTRRVARAMEVLHSSGPGSKVRVMRAAYHASAAPGLPASSYMMHASRRVFSSGFNFLEQQPSLPSEPLEISSTPLESSPEHTDSENYKVTEPDDIDISEPSKWKNVKTADGLRMPSEESSSTAENASIIDLDPRNNHKNILRKYSYDSENSDINFSGRNSRVSPLLDAPVTLSTLKFKSLLNGSNDWNSRRKSYSFEDTSPLTDSILHSNDTLAMESSTDSGICKSTELVNDHQDDNSTRYFDSKLKENNKPEDSFQSWLSKNRQNNSFYKGPRFKSYREHEVVTEEPPENNITLQSTGKVSITLPIKVETDNGYHYQKNYISEDGQRKVKKVEFCKTELHFAVDTGKVNIIATDEKPPPTNDFRKRRSAFVPMHEIDDPPIISRGDQFNEFPDIKQRIESLRHAFYEGIENDENTAATKGILKNRIPKPKPYLLGENMAFGSEDIISKNGDTNDVSPVLTAVSLINRQLQSENRTDTERATGFIRNDAVIVKNDPFATINQGPTKSSKDEIYGFKSQKVVKIHEEQNVSSTKNIHPIKRSPTPGRIKTRELRDSDLTYFGIDNQPSNVRMVKPKRPTSLDDSTRHVFESVKLIQQVSNSVCNSENEDVPEYINLPLDATYAPVPTPRIRSKFDDQPNQIDEIRVFKPIIEQHNHANNNDTVTRRSRFRRHEELSASRSLSEPRKGYNSPRRNTNKQQRCIMEQTIKENDDGYISYAAKSPTKTNRISEAVSEDETAIYVNFSKSDQNIIRGHISKINSNSPKTTKPEVQNKRDPILHRSRKLETPNSSLGRSSADKVRSKRTYNHRDDKETMEKKNQSPKRASTQKEYKVDAHEQRLNSSRKTNRDTNVDKNATNSMDSKHSYGNHVDNNKPEHRSRSSHRHITKEISNENKSNTGSSRIKKDALEKISVSGTESNSDTKVRKRHSSKDKNGDARNETVKTIPKVENSTLDKSTVSRDAKLRHNSNSRKSEYVINYDDKNGTVSSVSKVRSSSPRRKKTTRDVVKEKFRENLKTKPSDKAALLQPEDHQRNVDTDNGKRKRKSKMHKHRSCQVL